MRTHLTASLGVLLLLVSLAASQTATGHVTAVVADGNGRALAGVTVHLTGPETRRGFTDARGQFTFRSLQPGTYQLRFERTGFEPITRPFVLRAGATEHVKVAMSSVAPQAQEREAPPL